MITALVGFGPNGNIAIDDITLRFGACIETTTVSDDDDDDVTTAADAEGNGNDDTINSNDKFKSSIL